MNSSLISIYKQQWRDSDVTVPYPFRDSVGRDFHLQRSVIHTSLSNVFRIRMTMFSENDLLMSAVILNGEEEEKVVEETDMGPLGIEEKANRRGNFTPK